MKKYAVAIGNTYKGTNVVHIVDVDNPIQAICKATGDTEDMFNGYVYTLDKVIQYYSDGDLIISEPVEI